MLGSTYTGVCYFRSSLLSYPRKGGGGGGGGEGGERRERGERGGLAHYPYKRTRKHVRLVANRLASDLTGMSARRKSKPRGAPSSQCTSECDDFNTVHSATTQTHKAWAPGPLSAPIRATLCASRWARERSCGEPLSRAASRPRRPCAWASTRPWVCTNCGGFNMNVSYILWWRICRFLAFLACDKYVALPNQHPYRCSELAYVCDCDENVSSC
jgi:hypothetical protein